MVRDIAAFLARRLGDLAARRRRGLAARHRRIVFAAAFVLFVGGFIAGLLSLPDVEQDPRWELLAVVGLLGVPLTLALNAAEYQVAAAVAAYKVPFAAALRIGFLATAANMLPIPGAILVRAHAIRKLGGSYGRIALSTGIVGLCFVGMTCVLASGVLIASEEIALGSVLAGAGLFLVALAFAFLRLERTSLESLRLLAAAAARATAAMIVKAGRLYLVLLAFGYEAGPTQALTLTVAAVIATTLGFFPGGLGAAEALAAALSPLVGLSAAVGFVVSAVDRLISMVGLAVIGGLVFLAGRRGGRAESAGAP
jgi:uncharacterized membrane protein YbhN (UPF0104 family)